MEANGKFHALANLHPEEASYAHWNLSRAGVRALLSIVVLKIFGDQNLTIYHSNY
jgi:hypothetical protein